MNINIEISKELQQQIEYCCIEMDIVTCQEGCCQDEPEHWTPAAIAAAIIETYIGDFRAAITIRPLPQKVWQHIQRKAGHSMPPQSPYRPKPDVVQRRRR